MAAEQHHEQQIFTSTHNTLIRATDILPLSLANWLPVLATHQPPGIWWRNVETLDFKAPFFTQTLNRQPVDQRQRCFTDFAALDELPEGMPLSALVFHVSRCGSTLFTQMLATLAHCVALSEPPVIDSLLYQYQQGALKRTDCIHLLRGVARALGQRRTAQQQHLVIKLDCWHLQHLDILREAFPQVPALFLYRQPLQVMASHQRQRGPQMLPGMLDPAWVQASDDLLPGNLDIYCLHVLNRFMLTALTAAEQGQLVPVNYASLPDAVPDRLLPLLGITLDTDQRASMLERTQRHAKGREPYRGDPPSVTCWGEAPDADLLQRAQALYDALNALKVV